MSDERVDEERARALDTAGAVDPERSQYRTTVYPNAHVEIVEHRWMVRIIIVDGENDGRQTEYVASADSAFTGGSGIWFGTVEEYEEEAKRW